jgi:hypothetical protein
MEETLASERAKGPAGATAKESLLHRKYVIPFLLRQPHSWPPDTIPAKNSTSTASLTIVYSYGDFSAATNVARSADPAAVPIKITRASCVPASSRLARTVAR